MICHEFVENQQNELKILVNWVVTQIENIGISLNDILDMSDEEIESVIVRVSPPNIKTIGNYLYVFRLYAKYCNNEDVAERLINIDRRAIWKKYKNSGNATDKFISNEEFQNLIFNVETFEPLNADYYSALLRCLYEGIYNEDLSVIKNLRASDVNVREGNVYIINDNKEKYKIKISFRLAEDLIELGNTDEWERKNRYGVVSIKTEGKYPDSVFKVENRGSGDNYRYSYFSRIRKISKEYLERPLKPMDIYISGIMNRIRIKLEEQGHDLEYAFITHIRKSYDIIANELENSHYHRDTKYFRQMVAGHLDEFV